MSEKIIQPNSPWWASVLIFTIAISSFLFVFLDGPMRIVENSSPSIHSGAAGAFEVVKNGGFPVYISSAIPFFLAMIVIEFLITRVAGSPSIGASYSWEDSWSSLAAGITQQLMVLIVKRPMLIASVPYSWIHSNFAIPLGLAAPVDSAWTWLAATLAVDLGYYWLHRKSHEIAALWAGHGVHHSSDHYNLSTALRQSWVQALAAPVFFLPLALSFPPALYLAMEQANIVYQFWVHTCLVRRLPWPLEAVLMTPSHHRVHHDRRVHKNFGGFLIIWDRLFGSFLDEQEAFRLHSPDHVSDPGGHIGAPACGKTEIPQEEVVIFGVLTRQDTWTEAVTQSMLWQPVWRAAKAKGAPRMLKPPSATAVRIRYVSELHPVGKIYIFMHFLTVMSKGLELVVFARAAGPLVSPLVAPVGAALGCLYVQGLLLDCDPAGRPLEALRLIATMAWLLREGTAASLVDAASAAACAASLGLLAAAPSFFRAKNALAAPAPAPANKAAPGNK